MPYGHNHAAYVFASPRYYVGSTFQQPVFRYTPDGWPIGGLPDESLARDSRDYSGVPVNSRYRRQVARLITWREVLEANGYQIINRNRALMSTQPTLRFAGVRHDAVHGEIFYIYCVFHEERSSSLCLLPWGFHCFGCGANGSIVDFVAGINHLKSAQIIKSYFTDTFPQMQPRTK